MFFESTGRRHRYLRLFGVVAGVLMLGCQPLTQSSSPTSAAPPASKSVPSSVAASSQPDQRLPITAQALIKNNIVELEVARTRQEQATGLMGRETLADNRGMLFPFDPPQPVSFWMKNVLIDLDMVFLRNGEVIAVQHSAPPCQATPCPTYGPEGEIIDQVLELRGGRAAELGIQKGDRISIQPFSPES
ncbi:DUF192 domain-containing protein [Acaryochloris sp. IP29b_bin.148]|uniref:DUF192 domain-containing protein n=1 Tax=Acaryochloris sp. IP29b_bin.148 TaxID=2969218 RepID=UPI00261052E7|nr:DUF192 domain-containing protein [Acaryochloris sp. IP29b_bin.148]